MHKLLSLKAAITAIIAGGVLIVGAFAVALATTFLVYGKIDCINTTSCNLETEQLIARICTVVMYFGLAVALLGIADLVFIYSRKK